MQHGRGLVEHVVTLLRERGVHRCCWRWIPSTTSQADIQTQNAARKPKTFALLRRICTALYRVGRYEVWQRCHALHPGPIPSCPGRWTSRARRSAGLANDSYATMRQVCERSTLHYTILYYTILYYTILYYTILYYTILYYTIVYYTILYYAILCNIMLQYTIL